MFVRVWMTRDPIVVEPHVSLPEAYALLEEKKIRRLPVVENGQLCGVATLTDIQKLLFADEKGVHAPPPEHYSVRDIMTADPLTVSASDPIEKAALLMHRNRISSLPIVEDSKVVGIITETDIFKALITIMGVEQGGRRIALELEREGSDFQEILDLGVQYRVELLSVVTLHAYTKTHMLAVIRVRGMQAEAFTDAIRNSSYRVVDID